MKTIIIQSLFPFLLLSFSLPSIASCQTKASPEKRELKRKVDKYIKELQEQQGIPGITLAIIQAGEVIHRENYGYANLEHEVPVSDQSSFRLYSLTKPIIAVGIFSLIEQGKLSLKDPISKYVEGLPKKWKRIKIEHLLTHSSGLPDMFSDDPYEFSDYTEEEAKKRVFELPLNFNEGERFEYNQTNFWLLKEIIEAVSQSPLSDFIIQHQFPNAAKNSVYFSCDSRDIIKHRATPYFPFIKGELIIDLPYTGGDYFYAANGLHTTLENFIEWDKMFRENKLISEASKQKMWELFPYRKSRNLFTYGWGVSDWNKGRGYGFSGSLCTIYRIFPKDELTIIFLSNGLTTFYDMDTMAKEIADLVIE